MEFVSKIETLYSCENDHAANLNSETGTTLSEINIVPFVDVVLVLLLIFMITAPILQSGIEVDLPKTKTVKEITEARMVVTIDRAQRVYLDDTPVNIHDLGNQDSQRNQTIRRTNPFTCAAMKRCRLAASRRCRRAAASRHSKRQRGDEAA